MTESWMIDDDTVPRRPLHCILDKTPDGRHWMFQGWRLDETVVMFRFDYNASDEESEISAEIGVPNGGTLAWTSVATFQATVC